MPFPVRLTLPLCLAADFRHFPGLLTALFALIHPYPSPWNTTFFPLPPENSRRNCLKKNPYR